MVAFPADYLSHSTISCVRTTHPALTSKMAIFAFPVNCMVISLMFIDSGRLSSRCPDRYAGFMSPPCPLMTR